MLKLAKLSMPIFDSQVLGENSPLSNTGNLVLIFQHAHVPASLSQRPFPLCQDFRRWPCAISISTLTTFTLCRLGTSEESEHREAAHNSRGHDVDVISCRKICTFIYTTASS